MTSPRHVMRRLISQAAIFRDLSSEETSRLENAAESLSMRQGELLFRQGDPVSGLFYLSSGRVKLSQIGSGGQEMVMRIVGPGEVFAVLAAFEKACDFPVTAHALTNIEVAFWSREAARDLARSTPSLALALTTEIGRRAQEFQSRLREVATESVPERLAHMLIRLAECAGASDPRGTLIDFPLTRQDLAAMVGTTLFTTSRLLSEWADKGLLEIGRARVVVRSVAALRAEVESSDHESTS